MPAIRTEDEALVHLQHALIGWREASSGALREAAVVLRSLRDGAEQTQQSHARRLAAIAAAEQGAGQLRLATAAAAEAQMSHLASIVNRYADLLASLEAARRRFDGQTVSAVPAAIADLDRRHRHLEDYRITGGGPRSVGESVPMNAGSLQSGYQTVLAACGLSEVPLAEISFADNPILGDFGRGGATMADYRWAVETWETTVRPGVAAGLSRDDFALRDSERSAPPLRRTADVYDLFLGDTDRLRLGRQPNGGYDVIGGRHRVQVARDLGLQSLPASVYG